MMFALCDEKSSLMKPQRPSNGDATATCCGVSGDGKTPQKAAQILGIARCGELEASVASAGEAVEEVAAARMRAQKLEEKSALAGS